MIAAGFGFRQGATVASLRSAFEAAAPGHVDVLATEHSKADTDAIRTLEKSLGIQLVGVTKADLEAQQTLTSSPASIAAYGTGSVAEAAALFAAGPGAKLLAARAVSDDLMATCALAESAT